MDASFPGLDLPDDKQSGSNPAGYRVLARKYRPQSFDALIGQEALVRTLRNAIASGRIHHGYMLTGVRGVGKTTTARLIARALNYIGPDGSGEATVGPTDDCPVCQAIAEGRHVDVIEMDAASNTGVDDMREVIDSARYAPTEARYKVYIIDEVHMLSKSAFNALLKTLEEPPPSVIFIFATTEIRKVPVTVLSRCMRFDLRRVPAELLIDHFKAIAEAETVAVEDEALALVARAADGSVRDGLSLLDQAIALGDGKNVSVDEVRSMLGLADRQLIFDLMDAVISAKPDEALATYGTLHNAGAEALTVIQDMLELTHFITRVSLVPTASKGADVPEAEATRATMLAERLGMPALTRIWQILMAGLGEVQQAPQPHMAAEMVILRLCHAAGLPDPSDLVKKLKTEQGANAAATAGAAGTPGAGGSASAGSSAPSANQNLPRPANQTSALQPSAPPSGIPQTGTPQTGTTQPSMPSVGTGQSAAGATAALASQPTAMPTLSPAPAAVAAMAPATAKQAAAKPAAAVAANPAPEPAPETTPVVPSPAADQTADQATEQHQVPDFEAALHILGQQGSLLAKEELIFDARLVRFDQGHIKIQDNAGVKPELTHKLAKALREATGEPWIVELVDEPGAPPIRERKRQEAQAERDEVAQHPVVAAVLSSFPKANIVDIKNLNQPALDGIPVAESLSSDASDDVPFDPEDPGFDDELHDF
ncbi:MAG: DNA polymerase III subunit gamma/tau [Pseudomonadota bacterium]